MANTTLIYRPILSQIETIVLDASINEQHNGTNDITEHPVEVGSNITDHIRPKQDTLSIEAMITNTPMNPSQQRRVVTSRGVKLDTTSVGDIPRGAVGFAEQGYNDLRALKEACQLITVVTSLRTYHDMAIESLGVPRSASSGDALIFSMNFRQVRFVTNMTSKIVISQETKAHDKVDQGKKVAKTASNDEYEDWLGRYIVTPITGIRPGGLPGPH